MKRVAFVTVIVLAMLSGVGFFAYSHLRNGRNTLPDQYYQSIQTPQLASKFDAVVIIMEENKPKDAIIGNSAAPYINKLAGTYSQAGNYFAVTNPSLPNYIALTSGTTAGITNDCNPPGGSCEANVPNIADRLEQAHKTWKEYAEDMPAPCYAANSGSYAVRHNPFVYYPDITGNAKRCGSHVVPFSQLANDLKATNSMPDYALISPNLCHDMHNCSVAAGDGWLAEQVPSILNASAFAHKKLLLVIAWDEGDNTNNNVPAIFAGPAAKQGFVSAAYYSHYSLLRTIEANWDLQPLTENDKTAPLMTDMLR